MPGLGDRVLKCSTPMRINAIGQREQRSPQSYWWHPSFAHRFPNVWSRTPHKYQGSCLWEGPPLDLARTLPEWVTRSTGEKASTLWPSRCSFFRRPSMAPQRLAPQSILGAYLRRRCFVVDQRPESRRR